MINSQRNLSALIPIGINCVIDTFIKGERHNIHRVFLWAYLVSENVGVER